MSDEDTVEFKDHGLGVLVRALNKKAELQVGIIGSARRRKSEQTNAEIGRKHEFGLGTVKRSWLRMPLIENLESELIKSGAFSREAVREIIKERSMVPWYKKVGIAAEAVIAEAFQTGGFGKWKPSNMARKKVHQTLVETQQLRNSVTSKVTG